MGQSLQLSNGYRPQAQVALDLRCQEQAEGLGQLAVDGLVVEDQQLGEEHLVELPAQLRLSQGVRPVAVLGQGQGVVKRAEHPLQPFVGVLEVGGSDGELAADALLLASQQVQRQGAGVKGLEQLLALSLQLLPAVLLAGPLGHQLLVGRPELLAQQALQLSGGCCIEPDGLVLLLDQILDDVDRQGSLPAVRPPLMPPGADEVLVAGAVAVGLVVDEQPGAAAAAEDAALEVVVVETLLLAGVALGAQTVLDGLPQLS